MIVKYVGSSLSLNNISRLALVYTDSLLITEDINDYTLDYSGYKVVNVLSANSGTPPVFGVDTDNFNSLQNSTYLQFDDSTVYLDDRGYIINIDGNRFYNNPTIDSETGEVSVYFNGGLIPEDCKIDSRTGEVSAEYDENKDKFSLDITKDHSELEFNAMIFYSDDMVPLGFVMLDDSINTNKYKINTLIINPKFLISSSGTLIELKFIPNYRDHISRTASVHKKLFNKDLDKAMRVIRMIDYEPKQSRIKFTNITSDLTTDKYYRYSGGLMSKLSAVEDNVTMDIRGFNNNGLVFNPITSNYTDVSGAQSSFLSQWSKVFYLPDPPGYEDGGEYCESDRYVFISYKTYYNTSNRTTYSRIYISSGTNYQNQDIVGRLIHAGSNYCIVQVGEDNGYYRIYPSDQLFVYRDKPTPMLTLTHEQSIGLGFAKNQNGELGCYRRIILNGEIKGIDYAMDKDLIEVIDRLGVNNQLRLWKDIVAYAPGLLVYRTISNPSVLHFKTDTTRINNDRLVFNADFTYDLNTIDVEVLSSSAILIGRSSGNESSATADVWKLIQIMPDEFGYSQLKSISLGGKNNWRKLHLLAYTKIDPTNLNIIMTPIEGRLWKIVNNTLSRL